MSRVLPRPLVGLAAVALAAGLFGAPMVAHADSPTPIATPTSRSTGSTTSSSSPSAATPTSESSTTASPTAEESSSEPSASDSDETSASPSEDPTTATPQRSQANAIQAQAEAEDPVQGQAEPPGITLTKTASPTTVSKLGQVVTYTFAVRNSGGVALDNVNIVDQLEGLRWVDCTEPALVQTNQTLKCTATLTVTQDWLDFGDIDNFATVFGHIVGDDSEDPYVSDNASAHVSVDQKPRIALDASVSPTGTADVGDRLRYRATATNTGNVTLSAARVTSSLDALDLNCDPSARATLAPGASITCAGSYRVTKADARRGRVSNTLTARAAPPYGDDITDSVKLRVAVHKPAGEGSDDSGLADTGGPDGALPAGVAGVAALLAGTALVRRGRRA